MDVHGCCRKYDVTIRRKYSEIGNLSKVNCCGCVGFKVSLTINGPLFPSCGFDEKNTDDIVFELTRRTRVTNDIRYIIRTEEVQRQLRELEIEMEELSGKVKSILNTFESPKNNEIER